MLCCDHLTVADISQDLIEPRKGVIDEAMTA